MKIQLHNDLFQEIVDWIFRKFIGKSNKEVGVKYGNIGCGVSISGTKLDRFSAKNEQVQRKICMFLTTK